MIYDAAKARCPVVKGPRAVVTEPCLGTVGDYLLSGVRVPVLGVVGVGGTPLVHATITLLERAGGHGNWTAVDSAGLTLPADTRAHQADPPIVTAPDLQAILPVP